MLELISCEYRLQGEPEITDNTETKDQLIEPSDLFPKTRNFIEALRDIRKDYEKAGYNK